MMSPFPASMNKQCGLSGIWYDMLLLQIYLQLRLVQLKHGSNLFTRPGCHILYAAEGNTLGASLGHLEFMYSAIYRGVGYT